MKKRTYDILEKEWIEQSDGREICNYCMAERKFGHEVDCKTPHPFIYKTRIYDNTNNRKRFPSLLEIKATLSLNSQFGIKDFINLDFNIKSNEKSFTHTKIINLDDLKLQGFIDIIFEDIKEAFKKSLR